MGRPLVDPYGITVNIDSDDVLLPEGTKLLPESMLTHP